MKAPAAQHARALVALAIVTVVSGASFVLFKASVLAQQPFAAGESTWFIAAHNLLPRFWLGALGLGAVYGGAVLRLTRAEWTQAVFMAVTSFAGCMFQTDGLQYTTAATTGFLTQFYVILVPLWWALAHRQRPPVTVLLAGLLVLAGVAVLARVDWHAFRIGRGEGEVLASTVFFSLLLCSLNWPAFAANRAERTSTVMFLIEGGLFAVVSLWTCRDPAHLIQPYTSPSWLALVVLAATFGTVTPFVVMNHWQRFIPAAEAALLYSFSPVVAALSEVGLPALFSRWFGVAYANQPLSFTLVTGGALILAANVVIQLPAGGASQRKPT